MQGYLTDAVEEENGDFVLTGMHNSQQTLTRYHDLWLLRIDSTGCPSTTCLFPTDVAGPLNPAEALRLYPNPTRGQFSLESPDAGSLHIFDITGRMVHQAEVAKGTTAISLPSALQPGTYIARLKTSDRVYTVKIMYEP